MWRKLSFEKCLSKTKTPPKLQKKDYLVFGTYPVVSQEAALINGYSDDPKMVFRIKKPVIIFGDHTQVLKFIDFDFVMGADGAKIIEPIEEIDTKYFLYVLSNMMPKGTGYARHYKFLKDLEIPFPPLAEQQKIVEKLDRAFEEIDRAIEATERKQEEVSALKSAVLSRELNSSDLGGTVKLGEICQLRNGRAYSKAELLSEGKYPVLRVGNFFTSDKWYYSDLELEDSKYCDCGDLLYAWSASFGPQIWSGEKVIYHYHIWRVDIDSQLVDKKFLFYWFEHDKELIKKASGTGTTMLHVSKGSMEKRELSLPPLAEQQKIVEKLDQVFSSANEAWEYFSTQLEHYKQLKSAILAQELKGPES